MHRQGFFKFTFLAEFGQWWIRVRRRKDGLFLLLLPPQGPGSLILVLFSLLKLQFLSEFLWLQFSSDSYGFLSCSFRPRFFFFFFPYKNVCLLQREKEKESPREIISLVYKVKNLEDLTFCPNGNRFNRNKDLCYFLVSALCRLEKIL